MTAPDRPAALPERIARPARRQRPARIDPMADLEMEKPWLFLPDVEVLERLSQPEPAMPPSEG